jgi:hypothetical protein
VESRTVQGKEESSRGWEASSRERVVAGFFLTSAFFYFSFSFPLFFYFFYNLLTPARPLNIVATAIHVALLAARAILLAAAKVPTFSPAGE